MRFLLALLLILDLNTATITDLSTLPGVGPTLARRIVEFREKKGGFRRVEELLAIPGISEKKFRALREHLKVEPRAEIPEHEDPYRPSYRSASR